MAATAGGPGASLQVPREPHGPVASPPRGVCGAGAAGGSVLRREARGRGSGVKTVTVELEVRDWRESRATGENLSLIFPLRREDVSAQVPAIILGERERG